MRSVTSNLLNMTASYKQAYSSWKSDQNPGSDQNPIHSLGTLIMISLCFSSLSFLPSILLFFTWPNSILNPSRQTLSIRTWYQFCFGFAQQAFVAGELQEWLLWGAGEASPWQTELIRITLKMNLLQDKAKPISDRFKTCTGEVNLCYRICSQREEKVLTASLVSNIYEHKIFNSSPSLIVKTCPSQKTRLARDFDTKWPGDLTHKPSSVS